MLTEENLNTFSRFSVSQSSSVSDLSVVLLGEVPTEGSEGDFVKQDSVDGVLNLGLLPFGLCFPRLHGRIYEQDNVNETGDYPTDQEGDSDLMRWLASGHARK